MGYWKSDFQTTARRYIHEDELVNNITFHQKVVSEERPSKQSYIISNTSNDTKSGKKCNEQNIFMLYHNISVENSFYVLIKQNITFNDHF